MKKNYINPELNIELFVASDAIMASVIEKIGSHEGIFDDRW